MIESITSTVIGSFIPAEYMPLVVLVLTALVGIEQWLAATKRIQANSTVQLITGIAMKLVGKNTNLLAPAPVPDAAEVKDIGDVPGSPEK